MKQIGIFAGTFDPIHNGHLAVCEAARQAGVDLIFIIVERAPRHKQDVTAYEDRRAMMRLAIQGYDYIQPFELPDDFSTAENILPALQQSFPGVEFVVLMGSDVFMNLPKWENLPLLSQQASFMVAARTQHEDELIQQTAKSITPPGSLKFTIIHTPAAHATSSQVRQELQSGQAKDVDKRVAEYCQAHKLYVSSLKS